ncbi:MAG TPA: hypothetical protein ENI82_06385 [Bacteroidetes bacterium]|nr:hypothetical protein [Bacteroidota bacterium]
MEKNTLIAVFFILFFSCANSPQEKEKEKEIPNTPETVALSWLEHYYNNRFEEAKLLSTAKTKIMIDTIKELVFTDAEEEEIGTFKIADLICSTKKDSSFCKFLYQEGDLEMEDELLLISIQGQWLVDDELRSNDDILEEDVEKIFEEFENVLEEELDRD